MERTLQKNSVFSNIRCYTNCEAYYEIIKFGEEVFPVLYRYIKKNEKEIADPHNLKYPLMSCLPLLLHDLTKGNFIINDQEIVQRICDGMVGIDVEKAFKFSLDWLEGRLKNKKA